MLSLVTSNAENTAKIVENTETIDHLVEVGRMYGWIAAIVVGLLVYTWSQKEKTQDKLEKALINHIKEDDVCHNKIFDELRNVNHTVDELLGEHNGRKGSGC